MIETLGSKVASPVQGDPMAPALEITGITFDGGNLARPLYPSLIDHSRAPAGVQFEPCLQIRQGPVGLFSILFEIDSAAEVRFDCDPLDNVRVSSIFDPQSFEPPGLQSAKLVDGNPKKCELVWDQSKADEHGLSRLNTLRLHCVFLDGRPLTPVEQVEGGLYVAILNKLEHPFADHDAKEPGLPVYQTVKMLGFDGEGRPVYDLFIPQALPSLPDAFALEPAFRCREGQFVSFSLALDLPESIDIQFVMEPAPNANQVQVAGYSPEGRAFQIYETTVGEYDGKPARKCSLTWTQETGRQHCATLNPQEASKCYCTRGQSSSFGLRATPGGISPHEAGLGKVAEIDPTVIQPPSCTSGGICI